LKKEGAYVASSHSSSSSSDFGPPAVEGDAWVPARELKRRKDTGIVVVQYVKKTLRS
jgi:hypothetical protein